VSGNDIKLTPSDILFEGPRRHRGVIPVSAGNHGETPAEETMLYEKVGTAVIHDESLPWVPFTPYADNVFLKCFKLDPVRGEIIVMMKAPAGLQLPRHQHTGTVIVYTVEGSWKYKEHDWVATPGSVVFETAASVHTPQSVQADGEIVVLNVLVGDLIFLDDDDKVVAIENWRTMMQRYLDYCAANGLTPRDLTAFE